MYHRQAQRLSFWVCQEGEQLTIFNPCLCAVLNFLFDHHTSRQRSFARRGTIDLLYAPLIPIADDVGVEDPIRRASQGRDIAISH